MTPLIIESDDGGETWHMRPGPDGSGVIQDIVFLRGGNYVMVCTGNLIGKTDGTTSTIEEFEDFEGFEWTVVYDREKHGDILDLSVFTMQNSQKFESTVYASGKLWESSGNLVVLLSEDLGDQWQYSIYEKSPENIRTYDLAVVDIYDKETLILATDNGVFGFTID